MARRGRKTRKNYRRTNPLHSELLEPRVVLSASAVVADAYWVSHDQVPASPTDALSMRLADFASFSLDTDDVRGLLAMAPLEFTAAAEQPLEFGLPTPDGGVEMFAVVESPIMEPALAAQFPDIKTYAGESLDNPGNVVRFDVTQHGFHAQIRTRDGSGGYYIDPYYHLEDEIHVSYHRDDAIASDAPFSETVVDNQGAVIFQDNHAQEDHTHAGHDHADHTHADHTHANEMYEDHTHEDAAGDHRHGDTDPDDSTLSRVPRTGTTLRTYRAAIAATGEYTQFHGGTVASGQAAIVTMMNRVSGVYEDELTVRMVIVASNANIVYTSPGGDPFPGNIQLNTIQNVIDTNIGNANYDIGHLVDTGGGGYAGLGVIGVTGQKAWGYTGLNSPVNDRFWIDFVAHEMGHQFGGLHTFNGDSGSCSGGNRSGNSAYEPGSGSTIMAYAGICGNDNLQNNSDAYFHSRSLDQIVNLLDGPRVGVGTRTATGNTVPTADAGLDYVIPAETPFALTGTGSDADGDTLTYNWEQRDLGPRQDANAGDNGSSPIFRSWTGTTDPTRTLPRLQNLVINNTVRGETLPSTNRILDFRLTVRDNRPAGGGVATDNMRVDVRNAAGPFLVQTPNSGLTVWQWNQTQNVAWDVAGTNGNGINASQVNILLSTDGGFTYPITLAANTSNDGSHDIVVPSGVLTSDARVKVEAVGNIFFDISNFDFTIEEPSDSVAPSAVATAPDITMPGGSVNIADVTYTDDMAIDFSSIGTLDVDFVAPDGTLTAGFLLSTSSMTDTTPITATYLYSAPGGTWDAADVGTHDIRMVAGQVTDTAGNPVPAGSIGSFDVSFGVAIDGDFNDDGLFDCDDINLLTTEVASGNDSISFDLTADGSVNGDDITAWLAEAGAANLASGNSYIAADGNLDGVVDGSDFNIWNDFKFTNSTNWCEGNFNGDSVVDGSDFNMWNQNKFTSALAPLPGNGRIVEISEMGLSTPAGNARPGGDLDLPTPRQPEIAVPHAAAKTPIATFGGSLRDSLNEAESKKELAIDDAFARLALWM